MEMTAQETAQLQNYMQSKFGNKDITLKSRGQTTDSVEVLLGGEFIGVIYKDDEDGDTSYDFNMAILKIDIQDNQL